LYATARNRKATLILGPKSEQAAFPIKRQGALQGCGDFAIFSKKMRWHLLLALLLLPAARGIPLIRLEKISQINMFVAITKLLCEIRLQLFCQKGKRALWNLCNGRK